MGFEGLGVGSLRALAPLVLALCAALGACARDDLVLPSDPRARDTGTFPTFAATPAAAAPQLPQAQVNRAVMGLEDAQEAALGTPRPDMVAARAADLGRSGALARSQPAPTMVEDRIRRLDAAGRRARADAGVPSDDRAALERLARRHERETIARIEGRAPSGASSTAPSAAPLPARCADGTLRSDALANGRACPQ